jgi:hypothetical protein
MTTLVLPPKCCGEYLLQTNVAMEEFMGTKIRDHPTLIGEIGHFMLHHSHFLTSVNKAVDDGHDKCQGQLGCFFTVHQP